jgi:hypothetical protein
VTAAATREEDEAPVLVRSRECAACLRRVATDVSRCPACGLYALRPSPLEPEVVPFKMRRPLPPPDPKKKTPGQELDTWLAQVRAKAAAGPPADEDDEDDDEDFDDLELDDEDDAREIRLGPDGEPEAPSLRIGRGPDGFRLPIDAVTQTFALLARRGQGKSHTASVLIEEMAGLGLPVIAIDPVGALWGLSRGRDGVSSGLEGITVLGGDHGEEPIALPEARAVAAMVLDRVQDGPIVLDVSHLRIDDQKVFVRHFLEELFHLQGMEGRRMPLHLVVDESDMFAPQMPMGEIDRNCLNALEACVRRGRSRGIGVTLISQRSSVVNKNVLTQTECLIVFQTTSPQDRDAIDEWIRMHGDASRRKILLQSLAKLPRGTAWIWSPAWLKCFERVKIRQRRTFDSSATPKVTIDATHDM